MKVNCNLLYLLIIINQPVTVLELYPLLLCSIVNLTELCDADNNTHK